MAQDLTPGQQEFVERMALQHDSVAVRDGFADGHVNVTVRSGRAWIVPAYGTPRETVDASIDWVAKDAEERAASEGPR